MLYLTWLARIAHVTLKARRTMGSGSLSSSSDIGLKRYRRNAKGYIEHSTDS
jgi:hypothetical protein